MAAAHCQAERAGFEPAVNFRPHGISSAAPSAARPPLRESCRSAGLIIMLSRAGVYFPLRQGYENGHEGSRRPGVAFPAAARQNPGRAGEPSRTIEGPLGSRPLRDAATTLEEAIMRVKVFDRQGRLVGPVDAAKIVKTDAEWSAQLTPEQFRVARGKGTERAFCGTLLDNKRQGVYACVCCGLPLFASSGKFHSGHRLAQLFPARGRRERDHFRRSRPRHGPNRDSLRPLRRPPRPRLRGRSTAHRPALLRQLRIAGLHRRGRACPPRRPRRRFASRAGGLKHGKRRPSPGYATGAPASPAERWEGAPLRVAADRQR